MAARILHPEWRESHETTKYPFSDSATLSNGSQIIPETVFLDAIIHPIGGRERMYLTKLVLTHETCAIYIGDVGDKERASASFTLLDPPDELPLSDAYGRPAGLLVSSSTRLAVFQAFPVGTHEFTVAQTEFLADVCVPTPEIGFRGFVLADGSVFAEDIWIVAEEGFVLTPDKSSPAGPACLVDPEAEQVLQLNVVGDPLFRRRLCEGIFEAPRFLQRITVQNQGASFTCQPTGNGDFKLTTGRQDATAPVLRVRNVPEGLLVEAVGEKLKDAQ